jgi:hypothetical protein
VAACLRVLLNMPTIILRVMTEKNGCRLMPELVLITVIKLMSLSVDHSAIGESVTFH